MKKYKKRPHTFPVHKIDRKYHGLPSLTKEQLQTAKDRLKWFEKRDEDKAKTDKAKNDFESIIYSMRDWLYEEENLPFVGTEKQEELLKKLLDSEDWLIEGEGEHASHVEYNKRFSEFNKEYSQFKLRKNEASMREDAVQQTITKLDTIEQGLKELSDKKPWITDEQKKDAYERLEETRKWLNEVVEKQKTLELSEDPAFKLADIDIKMTRLSSIYTRVSSIAKPKETKKKEKKIPKNIKIDNITIDGNEDIDWGDFIKINNGEGEGEEK